MKYDVFISYRRDGGEYTAKMIFDKLSAMGYRVFFDVESMRSGPFDSYLYSVIDQSKDIIVVLSPESLERCENEKDWVRREIEHGFKKKKNIIPVMLRGFEFPKTLPDSMSPLIYENGIEVNTQFFDAFINKLTQFVHSKPVLLGRLKKKIDVIVQVLCIVALLFAVYGIWQWNTSYPRTQKETQITEQVISYISSYLNKVDEMAGAYDTALQAIRRYLCTNETDDEYLKRIIRQSKVILSSKEIEELAPTEDFLNQLEESPFTSNNFVVVHSTITRFKVDWYNSIVFLEGICNEDWSKPKDQTIEMLESYQTILENYLIEIACVTNEILLPVTKDEALEGLWYNTIPALKYIPLDPKGWADSSLLLQNRKDVAYNNIDRVVYQAEQNTGTYLGNVSLDELAKLTHLNYVYSDAVLEELLRYVSKTLQMYDLIGEIYIDVLEDAVWNILEEVYDQSAWQTSFASAREKISKVNIEDVEPSHVFLKNMSKSAVDVAELQAMYDELVSFQEECISELTFLEQMLDFAHFSRDEKVFLLNQYKKIVEEYMEVYAYCVNEMLIPVDDRSALKYFMRELLDLSVIPLRESNWSWNRDDLHGLIDKSMNTIEKYIYNCAAVTEGLTVNLEDIEEDILQELVDQGYTRATAEKILAYQCEDPQQRRSDLVKAFVQEGYTQTEAEELADRKEKMLEAQAKIRIGYAALTTDDSDTLWEKLILLMSVDLYEEALECAQLYQGQMTNSSQYLPAIQLFIHLRQQTTLDFGIMVMEYYEADEINEVLKIGDIIYGFDGKVCPNVETYLSMKEAVTTDSYVVDVLRIDGETGQWEQLQLTLTTDMPRVYLNDLTVTE